MKRGIFLLALFTLTLAGFSQKSEKVPVITVTKMDLAKVRYIHELFPDIPKSVADLFASIVAGCSENKQIEPINNGSEALIKDDVGTAFSEEQLNFFKKVQVGCKVYIDIKYKDKVIKNSTVGIKVTL